MAAAPALAATPAEILAANQAATAGDTGSSKITLKTEYAYSGQGMTGTTTSLSDLKTPRFVDTFAIGPAEGANGFDGSQAWAKDPSGTVTVQSGGDQRQLAVNDAYRRANLWWRPDFGGAAVVSEGEKTEAGAAADVLTITPKEGKPFDAWFDARTHFLTRLVEAQGPQTVTTTMSDYRSFEGVMLPYKGVQSSGVHKYDSNADSHARRASCPRRPMRLMPCRKSPSRTIRSLAVRTKQAFPFGFLTITSMPT